jgi:uncharacterized membrane protein
MSDLIVVAFDQLDDAQTAMRYLRSLEKESQLSLEDTAIVERAPDGKVHVRNELSGTTEKGAGVGAVVGALLAVVFPIAGIVVGAAAGAAIGAMLKTGIDRHFVERVEDTLSPGRSALFLVIREGSLDAVMGALREFRGEVIQTTLPSDAEAELRDSIAR